MKTLRNLIRLISIVAAASAQAAMPNATPLGAMAGQLHGPACVAADTNTGTLYVTDPAAGRVHATS